MRQRPRFSLRHLAPLVDNVPRTLATMLMMETPLLVLPVTAMPVSKMQTPMVMMVPMMDTGAGHRTTGLGEPLRGRAFRSNLRFAPISTAIPLASVRSAHCALRLPDNRTRRADMPDTAPDIRFVLLAPARRAALVAACASVALRASPVPASPSTGLRIASGTGARTGADSRADASVVASGSVLRTTACGSCRTDRHSIAVAAPLRRLRRRRFPER